MENNIVISTYIEELKKSVQSKLESNNSQIDFFNEDEWKFWPAFKGTTQKDVDKMLEDYENENKVLQIKLDWLNQLNRFYE